MLRHSRFAVILTAVIAAAAFNHLHAGFTGTDLFLPSVGRAAGVADWYTTIWVHNPEPLAAEVQFFFLKRNQANPSPMPVVVKVPSGETLRYADVLAELFDTSGFGAIRIVSDRPILVTSRIFSKAAGDNDDDSKGQDLPGIPASFAIGAGERTEILGVYQRQPASSSDFRTNYGFVETTGSFCTVQVTPIDGDGAPLATPMSYDMHAFEQRQVQFSVEFPSVSTTNARLEVRVTSGIGRVIAFGSSIANRSQDPTTFEMQFRDALIGGGGEVVHDGTLTGDGTSSSPLGVADSAISKAKLEASGGSSGQVLSTNGASLLWRPDGLSLPYSNSAALGAAVFSVTNTAGHAAIEGRSQTGSTQSGPAVAGVSGDHSSLAAGFTHPSGVWGDSRFGNGVTGTSDQGVGIYGQSAYNVGAAGISETGKGVIGAGGEIGVEGATDSGDGVHGRATTGNGVYGESESGYAGRFDGRMRVEADTPFETDGFKVANAGGGRGLTVTSTTDTALWAVSTSGAGIDARSTSGNGINATSSTGYAGYFFGKVAVTGPLTKLGGGFKIDHPLDPSGMYLYHSFVESPDMKNIYDGVVITDEDGRAVVELPEWFEALNRDFRYQLTVIGCFARAMVEEEIANNSFTIRTDMGEVKVSWQVTGIRRDAWADANRLPVEEVKPDDEQGTYLNPEAYDAYDAYHP